MTMNRRKWAEISQEASQLCKLHDDAIANYEKCREFANRMSLFLALMEDLDLSSMANTSMDILTACNPKVASHCERANMVKGRLEHMKAEIDKKL